MIGRNYVSVLKEKRMAAFRQLKEALFERKVQRLIPAMVVAGVVAGLLLAVL